MACTFDESLPAAKDRVRLAIGDIGPWTGIAPDQTGCLRSDETINATITANGEAMAVAILAESLAMQFAQQPDTMTADGATISYRNRVEAWAKLATNARKEADAATGSGGNATVSRRATRGGTCDAEYYRPPWVEVEFPRFSPGLNQGGHGPT